MVEKMGMYRIWINDRVKPSLERWKNDIRKVMNITDVSDGKAIELLLSNPKVVMLPSGKKKKRMEIRPLY